VDGVIDHKCPFLRKFQKYYFIIKLSDRFIFKPNKRLLEETNRIVCLKRW